jgi:chemotaxis protein MotA
MSGAGFSLINAEAGVIVLGGTLLASGLACGWDNLACAGQQAWGLMRAPLDEAANRAALARLIHAIDRKGRFAAAAPLPPDPVLAEIVAAYLRRGALAPMHAAGRTHHAASRLRRHVAAATWRHAGELAPVAGLAGTLYGIAGLAPVAGESTLALTTATAIATAVLTTLYGLLLAHLVCLPLAGAIIRRAQGEQRARSALVTWFESQLPVPPGPAPAPAAAPAHPPRAAPTVLEEAA